ncbi:transcriptional repressor LexA [Pendulispora rubella]|uniref:transcriptional repressor LexA n=1 Tax=Pendulispora rubella TaxID=2741070 RepID=UPI00374E070B
MQGLTQRQQMVLDFIRQSIADRGYPPTLREIGARMGIRSTNGVNDHLRALERKGYLTREDMKSRALRPTPAGTDLRFDPRTDVAAPGAFRFDTGSPVSQAGALAGGWGGSAASDLDLQTELPGIADAAGLAGSQLAGAISDAALSKATPANDDDLVEVQVLGRVAAGLPIFAEEHVIDTVRIDRGLLRGGREVFGLRVQGDSMIEAGILSGDYIFVRKQLTASRGDIVVALIGDEATVKYYFPEKDYVRFQPANKEMAPILVRAVDFRPTMLLGVVVGVYRRL